MNDELRARVEAYKARLRLKHTGFERRGSACRVILSRTSPLTFSEKLEAMKARAIARQIDACDFGGRGGFSPYPRHAR